MGKNLPKAEMNSYPIGWWRMESRMKNWRSLHYYTENMLYTLYYLTENMYTTFLLFFFQIFKVYSRWCGQFISLSHTHTHRRKRKAPCSLGTVFFWGPEDDPVKVEICRHDDVLF